MLRWQIKSLGCLWLVAAVCAGCLKRRDSGAKDSTTSENAKTSTVSMDPALGTISSASALEVQSGQVSLKDQGLTTRAQCDPGSGTSLNGISSDNSGYHTYKFLAASYTPSSNQVVGQLQAKLLRGGTPSGNLVMRVYSDSAGVPQTSLGESSPLDVTTISESYAWYTFAFSAPIPLVAGTKYHIALTGGSNLSAQGNSAIYWASNADCDVSPFGFEMGSTDGSAWFNAEQTFGYHIMVRGPSFVTTSPTLSLTHDAGAAVTWDPSTFDPDENPNGEQGALTYDVGVSGDGTEIYSVTGYTKAEVQNLPTMTGRYLHLRANFGSSGAEDVTIGAIGVSYAK